MDPLRVPYKSVNGIDIPTDIHLPYPSFQARNGLTPVLIMIHGGGFILGFSKMNNMDQIQDCLSRGWIVLSIEYRLCPGVDLLEGPISDSRDVLRWVQNGGLASALREVGSPIQPDPERVMAMGASAGGHLSLCMGWNVEKQPIAILDFYGPTNFQNAFWVEPIKEVKSSLPPAPPDSEYVSLFRQNNTIIGGISLEGQSGNTNEITQDDINEKRKSFAMQVVANGRVLHSIWPDFPNKLDLIDPALNVHANWPPTAIVHGNADHMVPMHLSKSFEKSLREEGVEVEFVEVEGEPHTFLGKMVRGSATWETQKKGFDFLEKVLRRSYL